MISIGPIAPGDLPVTLAGEHRAGVAVLTDAGVEEREALGGQLVGERAAVDEFLPGRGPVEALDGVQASAQVAGDLAQAAPFGAQPVDQGVVPPSNARNQRERPASRQVQ